MSLDEGRARADASDTRTLVLIAFGFVMGGSLGLMIGFAKTTGCAGIQDAPWGCAEFLLYRYQTLIAAAVAIAIAFIAARPVFQQIAEMRRQNAATARVISMERVAAVEKESDGVVAKYLDIELDVAVFAEEVEDGIVRVPAGMIDKLIELRKALVPQIRSEEGSTRLAATRRPAYKSCAQLVSTLSSVQRLPEGDRDRPDAAAVRQSIETWTERWDDYRQALAQDRKDALQIAKRYEAIVHAGF